MNIRGNITFTIGIARCGKSTYCNKWINFLENSNTTTIPLYTVSVLTQKPRVIVCSDDIRLGVHGERYNRDAEAIVWTIHTYATKAHLIRGCDVIIDGTNTTEESIKRILRIDSDAKYVFIDTDVNICEERAMACGQADLVTKGVIRRHARQLQDLKDQGIDTVVELLREEVKGRYDL